MQTTTNSLPFAKRVALLAVPMALQMLLQSAMGMADVFMVSGLGQEAIAAVGLAAKLHFLLTVLMAGIGTSCSIFIAQYFGANDLRKCADFLAVTLLVGGLTMLPCMVLFAWHNNLWLSVITPDEHVVTLASTYLFITAPALLITQGVVIYESALRATGNTTVPLYVGVVAGIANVILNYVLIFGKFGFPELGVAGAAWGTLLARGLQLTVFLVWLYGKKHRFALTASQFIAALNRPLIWRFVGFTFPLAANYLIWALGNATYHIFTGYSGTNALATMGILVPIESAFFALFIGLANAASVMIGHSLGANNLEGAWHLYKIFDRLAMSLGVIFCAVLLLLRPWIISLFSNIDPDTAALLNQSLLVFCLLTWVKILNLTRIIGVLRAGGDNHYVLWVDTAAMWGLGVPVFLSCIFWFELPFVYVFLAMYLEDVAKALPMHWRIRRGYWVKNLTTPSAH